MKKVEVKLVKSEGSEILRFGFDTTLEIELLSDDAQKLKDFFQLILERLFLEEFEFEFIPEHENDLYTEVSKKYVALLDTEIKTIKNQLPKE
jgi:hypothetical protein